MIGPCYLDHKQEPECFRYQNLGFCIHTCRLYIEPCFYYYYQVGFIVHLIFMFSLFVWSALRWISCINKLCNYHYDDRFGSWILHSLNMLSCLQLLSRPRSSLSFNLRPIITVWAPRSRSALLMHRRISGGCIKSPQANTWVDSDLDFYSRGIGLWGAQSSSLSSVSFELCLDFLAAAPAISRSNVLLTAKRTGGSWCMLR